MQVPCFGCGDRKQGCHGSCDRYKAFAAQASEERERRVARKNQIDDIVGVKKAVIRAVKRYHAKD